MIAFELACVVVVVATLAAMARARARALGARGGRDGVAALALDYGALAVAGYVGEASCIRFYGFYTYADAWHARLGDVPVLVPLIWPLVVLSGREVARVLVEPEGTSDDARRAHRLRVAAATGALVAFDASLVEVASVQAGFWSWAEPGHLGVPLVGIAGWGFFAFGATLPERRDLAVLSGLAATHALVLASWWGLFRWTLRGDLGATGFGLLAAGALTFGVAALRARRGGRALEPDVWGPRVLAAGLFFVVLAIRARGVALWAHAALVAAPYLVLTSLRASRSPGAPPRATPPSR